MIEKRGKRQVLRETTDTSEQHIRHLLHGMLRRNVVMSMASPTTSNQL